MATEKRNKLDWTGLIIVIILSPVFFLFMHFGKGELGRAFCIDMGCILVAVKIRWDLRKHFWFWGIVTVMLALHTTLLLLVKWPDGWVPTIAWLPLGLVSCVTILGSVKFVETFILKSAPSN